MPKKKYAGSGIGKKKSETGTVWRSRFLGKNKFMSNTQKAEKGIVKQWHGEKINESAKLKNRGRGSESFEEGDRIIKKKVSRKGEGVLNSRGGVLS